MIDRPVFLAEGVRTPQLTNRHVRREVNAAVRELDRELRGRGETISVLCECGRGGCLERFVLPIAEFDRAAGSEGWFVVAPGHEPRDERPLRRGSGYSLVGPTAADAPQLTELRVGLAGID